MLPLGRVTFPGEVVPLRIFEPRYLEMMRRIGSDGDFGTVLIDRGSEVGGGEGRTSTGTLVSVRHDVEAGPRERIILGVGVSRLRVRTWLEDDPYPRAEVEAFPDEPGTSPTTETVGELLAALTSLYALASELGADTADLTLELPSDPATALWTLCAAAPLGSLDRQRLIDTDTGAERASVLATLIDDVRGDLLLRLGEGGAI
jgi:Lon protease-like protein